MEFSGRLTSFPPADLLQWAAQEGRTGALVVRRSSREKRAYMLDGKVAGCLSDDPAEHYGAHLLLHGHLDEKQLVRALSHCSRTGQRLGPALTELGMLAPEAVRESERQRTFDVVCDLFLWKRGVFYFEAEPPPEEEVLADPIEVMELVLEGTRWIDEIARIRNVLVHDSVVLARGPAWPPQEPSPLERKIAAAADGRRTLAEIHRETRGSYFRFLDAAFRLCFEEVLDIDTVGEEESTDTAEMTLADLMLEQMGEEERQLVARRRLGVPLELLERLHPFRVAPLPEEESRGLSEPLRPFAAHLSGAAPLKELLSEDPAIQERQLDFLQLELRRGRLALLPASPEDLESGAAAFDAEIEGWWRRIFGGGG